MRLVTNIPEEGSRGHMEGEFDAVAAAAPYALNLPGCGDVKTPRCDIYQIVHAGYNLSDVTTRAARICQEKKTHIDAVATALSQKNTLGQGEVDGIMGEIDKGGFIP
jgi:hypothetical protein